MTFVDLIPVVSLGAICVLIAVVLIQNDKLKDEHFKIGRELRIANTQIRQLTEYLKPESPNYMEYTDIPLDSTDEHEEHGAHDPLIENVRLQERVEKLKAEIAQVKHQPPHQPLTHEAPTLHPDVHNLPHTDIPDTSYTIEYVK